MLSSKSIRGKIRVALLLGCGGVLLLAAGVMMVRDVLAQRAVWTDMAAVLLAGLAALPLILWLASSLERRLSGPILALTRTAKKVSERGDYTLRATAEADDELGALAAAFNQMVARVQEQAAAARLAEEMRSFLLAAVESSDDSIISKTMKGEIVSWNQGAERMFGYTAAEMAGQSIHLLISPDRPGEEERIQAEVRRGGTQRYETVRVRKDGQAINVSLTVSPIRNQQGDIIGISSISRNITERKKAEEQIHRMNAELEQRVATRTAELTAANRELEAFTYSVAHDLRAPLRHIDAFSRIVLEDFGSDLVPEGQQYLQGIRNGSLHLSRLVDDLLNLARVGRQELKRRPTPLNSLIAEALADLEADLKDRVIEWRFHSLPVVECDPGLMRQVFVNLLANAIKYTRPRPVAVIEVGCRHVDGRTAVFVRDNGVGFNMKYVHKLFRMFQRLHKSDEFEGTGVGLATVQRIIQKHGGSVWAEAVLNEGATFYFTLPGVAAAAPVAEQATTVAA